MKVAFSPDSVADLKDVFDYIARSNPFRAGTFVRELRDAAVAIADHPFAWPLIPRYEGKGFRRRVHRGYLIFFDASGQDVVILRILNGMQDYERLLFPKDERP